VWYGGQVESLQLSLELTWSVLEEVTHERNQLTDVLDTERQLNAQLHLKVEHLMYSYLCTSYAGKAGIVMMVSVCLFVCLSTQNLKD